MADQLGSAEIEDVLSSIRRLVAGDRETGTPQVRASEVTSAAGPEDPEDDANSALVLTPSLRVPADTDDAGDGIDQEAERWEMDAEDAPLTSSEDDETFAPWDPAATEPRALEEEGNRETVEAPDSFSAPFEEAEEDPEDDGAIATFIRSGRESLAPSSSAWEAQRKPDAHTGPDTMNGDGTSNDHDGGLGALRFIHRGSGTARTTPRAGFHFGAVKDDDGTGPGEHRDDLQADGAQFPSDSSDGLFDRPTVSDDELEDQEISALDRNPDDTEGPDWAAAPGLSNLTGETWVDEDPFSDEAGRIAEPGIDAEPDEPAAPETDNLFSVSDASIDEAVLRDLVAELLERELKGPLGERITRNVRKLVRQEIRRALASHDFD